MLCGLSVVVLAVASPLLAACGSDDGSASDKDAAQSPSSSPTATTPAPTATPKMGGGSLDHHDYASPLELAMSVPVVVLGTVASWEDGFEVVIGSDGEETRTSYAILRVAVDQELKDERGIVDDAIEVPVRLDDDRAGYETEAPVGSNVAFLGGEDQGLSVFGDDEDVRVEPAEAAERDAVVWGAFQGVIVESDSGELLNLDTYSRTPLWPEVAELPAEEQFGMLAQQLMGLRG